MNIPIILALPDRSVGQLHLEYLSDQTMMEISIDLFSKIIQLLFQDTNGEYKDVCKWMGIKCNGRSRVEEIRWKDAFRFSGVEEFSFNFLPRTLKTFYMDTSEGSTNNFQILCSLDTSALPRNLINIRVTGQELLGTVDFSRLPRNLESFMLNFNHCIENVAWTLLPKTLEELQIYKNDFSASVILCDLPPRLKCLPNSLELLDVGGNNLEGDVYLENLPRGMTGIILRAKRRPEGYRRILWWLIFHRIFSQGLLS